MPLNVRVEGKNPQSVFLEGSIDENSHLDQIFKQFTGNIILDLNGIKKMNSIGILGWIPAISDYSEKYQISVKNASYPIVIQLSSVSNLFGKAKIISCNAPYFCDACSKGHLAEVTKEMFKKTEPEAPVIKCPDCSTEMTFDDIPGYFNFFKNY
jgi:hypothetical protein